MDIFTAVDPTTGQVQFQGTADDAQALAGPGVQIILDRAPANTYWSGSAWVTIPARPSAAHVWNWTTKAWEDPRTLADHKTAKITQLKRARDGYIHGGFTWDGSVFDSDTVSQMRLMGLQNKALRDTAMVESWRLADNTWRSLNATQALQVWDTFEQHLRTGFQTFAVLEAQVLAASTEAEVSAVEWP